MNQKIKLIPLLLFSAFATQAAKDVKVMQYLHAGPITVNKPILTDSLNVDGKPFEAKNLVKSTIPFGRALGNAAVIDADTAGLITVPTPEKGYALHLYSFYLNSDRYTKGSLEVSGAGTFEVFVNNKPVGATSELALEPHRYEVVIKYLTADTDTCPSTLTAKFKSEEEAKVIASLDPEKRYTPRDILEGTQFRGTSVSPDGKYVLVKYYTRMEGGKSEQYAQLRDAATGRILLQDKGFILTADWMPTSSKMYFTRTGMNGKELVTVDPATMQEEILAENLPEGSFSFTPDEKTLLYTIQEEGPKDGPDMLRILEPNDRLPGFRNRYLIWRYDLQTGLYEQLTYGHNNTFINDVSADSRYLLFSTNEQDYTSLPHSSNSMYKLDLQSMAVDTLWERAKYINGATFSPDGKRLMVFGSGNAFDNIGLNIKEGQISNTYDGQLFLYDPATRKAKALTKDFNPNVIDAVWNRFNGQIYILCEDEDYQRIYTCDPANGKIKQVAASEDIIMSYALADNAPVLFYYGQSASNANRLYAYDLKGGKNRLVYDLSQDKLKDIALGEVHDWNFKSDDGTTIQGRYYLPPHFDPNKKYPTLLFCEGGPQSPVSQFWSYRWNMQIMAANDYIVVAPNRRGLPGFGMEWNEQVSGDYGGQCMKDYFTAIDEMAKESFVDKDRLGCVGASFGGFSVYWLAGHHNKRFKAFIAHDGIFNMEMQYLETEEMWFANWDMGGAYWEKQNATAQRTFANSPHLFVDKWDTPILCIHGEKDYRILANQGMAAFNAAVLRGVPAELLIYPDENHWVLKPQNGVLWQRTFFEWLDKWLKPAK